MAKFKSNSICEAIAYNLSKEELTKLGYDGYEAFDSLQCQEGYRLLSQPTTNLLSDEKYSTANIYAKSFGENILPVSDISKKVDMYRQEENENYSNLITNRYVSCEFPFSFNNSQEGFATIPLTSSSSTSYTFMYNGAVVPVMVKSDTSKSLNLPYNHFEWFIGSETNITNNSINNAVNNVVKRLMDTILGINPSFRLQDIRLTPQNFIMTRTEFINNYEQLHNLISDDSIGLLVDDSVDKVAFQTDLTTWDNLPDSEKTIDKFFTDIQNKYKYWIYFKCSPLILIPATATYLDIDKRVKTGLDYPTSAGYLDVSKIDFTKTYNSRLGQAGFHPRFLTKLLYGQVVQIPMNGTPPVLETYTEDIITIDKLLLVDGETANLTITLGKTNVNGKDYPNIMGEVESTDATKLVVTKVNDTSYTLAFTQTAISGDIVRVDITTKRTSDGTNYGNNHFSYTLVCGKGYVKGDNGSIGVIGGSSGGGGGNGSTGQGPGADIDIDNRTPPTIIRDDIDDDSIRDKHLVHYYNNSGVKGKAVNSIASIIIQPSGVDGYNETFVSYKAYDKGKYGGIKTLGSFVSKKHLLVHYNYLINQVYITEFDTDLTQGVDAGEESKYENYTYTEGDETKYQFIDEELPYNIISNTRTTKYVKRNHYLSIDTSPVLPTKQGDNITLIDLTQLGEVIEETESASKNNIYLAVPKPTPTNPDAVEKVLLGYYNPTSTKRVFETNYLPIQWLTDGISSMNTDGINDEVKGMFFIPGNNWLNDPTDITAPNWVQNPGIFGSLDGLVDIAGTTYKVSSLEESYTTLRNRTDKNYKINADDLVVTPTKTPYTFGGIEYQFVQDKDTLDCSTDLTKYKSKVALLSIAIFPLKTQINLTNSTTTSNYISYISGEVSHNCKNDIFKLEAPEFNKNNPPSVIEREYTSTYGNTAIKEATYLERIEVQTIMLSTRLPFQSLFDITSENQANNKLIINEVTI